jgi:3-hydroxyacyl-CoA dehydrogenase / enoyl-CoA hydratase / 3-hydroxybutyryl-CoA epimerase
MKTIRYELHDGLATITFDEPGSPVNTMCADWQRDLTTVTGLVVRDKALIRASSWPRPRAPSSPVPT